MPLEEVKTTIGTQCHTYFEEPIDSKIQDSHVDQSTPILNLSIEEGKFIALLCAGVS
jgi:hypothetical protein